MAVSEAVVVEVEGPFLRQVLSTGGAIIVSKQPISIVHYLHIDALALRHSSCLQNALKRLEPGTENCTRRLEFDYVDCRDQRLYICKTTTITKQLTQPYPAEEVGEADLKGGVVIR